MIRDRRLAFLLVAALFIFGCSSRQAYQSQVESVSLSPNAININTASIEQLESIPHIGPKTGENIIEFRTVNGPFRRPEYIMQIRGISEKRFAEIRQYLKTE